MTSTGGAYRSKLVFGLSLFAYLSLGAIGYPLRERDARDLLARFLADLPPGLSMGAVDVEKAVSAVCLRGWPQHFVTHQNAARAVVCMVLMVLVAWDWRRRDYRSAPWTAASIGLLLASFFNILL